MNEKYLLLGTRKRKNKEGKEYTLAFLLITNDSGYDIVNVLLQDKQINAIEGVVGDSTFDINKYLTLSYNSYMKRYQLIITYGL